MNQRQAIYLRVIIVSSIVHMNSFIKRIDQRRITFVLPLITATLVFLKLVSNLVVDLFINFNEHEMTFLLLLFVETKVPIFVHIFIVRFTMFCIS